ncbi:GLUG motif-containing protein [Traorella massiliensis]|uniref:GLUG motif-containing protein n=1 Tax=Traorella massiliensis TaxID=1903263 RepID=UPI0008F84E60|nr:GLUG motif-containing protein [Traorella massiliensis]
MRKKSFKSALTVLLSLMMILVMFPANAFAMDGEGTKENPYEIAAADDLYEFATKVNEGDNTACAVLTADITLIDTNWTPIGNDSNQYKGTFDGDGHTITGLSVDIQSDNTIYAGLFGFLGEGGTIKNLGLADSKITCSGNRVYAGGVCGWNTGTIQNCYNTGDVSGEGTQYVFVGGVCGLNDGTIENCYNTGDVSGTSEYGFVYAGGVCGLNDYGTIENCYNTGDVSGTGTRTDASGHAGGVCGCNDYGTIENCYNTGEVSGTGTSTDGAGYDGGVCGRNTGTIENCYNTGEVSGIYGFVYAGGVCGANGNSATIINCYNTGDVSGTSSYGFAYAGGVCGLNDYGTIENCYNTGEVSGTGTSTDGSGYAGGVCGWNTGTIENCYFLFGTGDKAVSINSGTVDNVEEKSAEAFASGEVAWLLNEPQTEKPWGQGSNGLPVLKGNLPDGVTSYVPVRITIVMTDNTQKSYYSAKGSTFTEYPTGYAFFFKDGDTKTWISKGTQTYDADATIYAENMPLEKIQAKAPTCTEDGNSAYWYSAAFDKYFKDENGVNEITAESTVIPAKGHGESEVKGAKEATCTEDGYTGDKVCKVCGEILERGTVIEKLGHVWGEPEWNWSEDGASCKVTFTCQNNSEHKESPNVTVTSAVKTPATCTESGVTTYTATVDFNGSTYTDTKEASVPATGHSLMKTDAKAPTCTEDGNIAYWYCETCDKYFSDETAAEEIGLADTVLEATGHSYENGKCTACGEIDPDFKAVIIEGANGSWQKGTKDGLSFTSNAAFAHFLKVQVDGKDLDASDYAVKEGSTIVTLKAEYLETLSVGKHTLAIVSETGTAETEFTIKAAAVADDTAVPQTGAGSNVALWIAVMLAAGTALTGTVLYSRKRKYSK